MEEGSSLLGLTSSPPPIGPTETNAGPTLMDFDSSSPTLPSIRLPEPPTSTEQRNESFLFSTDPLQGQQNLQGTDVLALNTRKRTFQGQPTEPHKPHRRGPTIGNRSKELVLQARDLVIKAAATASTHTEQTSLLDLLKY
jgi:hypothetical protein